VDCRFLRKNPVPLLTVVVDQDCGFFVPLQPALEGLVVVIPGPKERLKIFIFSQAL